MANSCNSVPKFISSDKLPFSHAQDLKLTLRSKIHFRAYASSRKSRRNRDRREEFEDFEMKETRRSERRSNERLYLDMNERKRERRGRGLITISPSGERWDSKWDCDYVLTLRDLQLDYLAADGEQGTEVHIYLTYQPHVGFGLSVHGRVVTSFNSECSWCSKIFQKQIDATFDVTVLPEPRESGLLELGGDDSVIYVKYGSEAELDSFIQDKIIVKALSQDICSKSCGDTPITLFSNERAINVPRWPQLLRLKEQLLEKETRLDLEKGSDSNSE